MVCSCSAWHEVRKSKLDVTDGGRGFIYFWFWFGFGLDLGIAARNLTLNVLGNVEHDSAFWSFKV